MMKIFNTIFCLLKKLKIFYTFFLFCGKIFAFCRNIWYYILVWAIYNMARACKGRVCALPFEEVIVMNYSLQKAGMWKRISAFMCDGVLTVFLAMIFAICLLSAFNYDEKGARFEEYRTYYAEQYGIDPDMTEEEYEELTEEQKLVYDENLKKANEALSKDKEAQKLYSTLLSLLVLTISLSLLFSDLILFFLVPLLFKNGRTLGKKVFGLAVVRTNSVKISNPILFVRSILGRYAMETMFPLAIAFMIIGGLLGTVGLIVLLLFVVLEVFVMIHTKATRSCIHDLLSDSVVVDYNSQRIFNSQEELIEYQKALAAEKAEQATY